MGKISRKEKYRFKRPELLIEKKWRCIICGRIYDDKDEALDCALQLEQPIFEVGDIVVEVAATQKAGKECCRASWYTGDKRWIYRVGLGPYKQPDHYSFYYVVSYMDCSKGHEIRYHLATRATQGHSLGWTTAKTHICMTKIKKPPRFILNSSKGLLGMNAGGLL